MNLSIPNESGERCFVRLLFTFETDGAHYAVFTDNVKLWCKALRWNLWMGYYLSDRTLSHSVYEIADRLLTRVAERESLSGEHFVLCRTPSGTHLKKCSRDPILSLGRKLVPMVLRLLFTLLMAVGIMHIFIRGAGSGTLKGMFPGLDVSHVSNVLLRIQLVGAGIMFFFSQNNILFLGQINFAMYPLAFTLAVSIIRSEEDSKHIAIALLVGLLVGFYFAFVHFRNNVRSLRELASALKKPARSLLSFALCFAAVTVLSLPFFVAPDAQGEPYSVDSGAAEAAHREALEDINENTWVTLSFEKKLDTLQKIADYECVCVLGIGPVKVEHEMFESDTERGEYRHDTKTVYIRTEHLDSGQVEEVVNTLLHEVRHSWQHNIVEMYATVENSLDVRFTELELFRNARVFGENYRDYKHAEDDEKAYYEQAVEVDSRSFASDRIVRLYISHIYADFFEQ